MEKSDWCIIVVLSVLCGCAGRMMGEVIMSRDQNEFHDPHNIVALRPIEGYGTGINEPFPPPDFFPPPND